MAINIFLLQDYSRGVAEWSNAAVLKTVVPQGTGVRILLHLNLRQVDFTVMRKANPTRQSDVLGEADILEHPKVHEL